MLRAVLARKSSMS